MNRQQAIEVLTKIQERDSESAFQELYNLCYNRFFRIAFYYLQQDEWAQEVVLDVFINLWTNRKRMLLPDNFDNYSFILIKNAALNYLEKEKRKETSPLEIIPEQASSSSSPEEDLLQEELFRVYLDALDELPERCREVFILIKEDKMSYAQVAEQLNISTKTVDAQLQKAVSRLKKKINIYFSDPE